METSPNRISPTKRSESYASLKSGSTSSVLTKGSSLQSLNRYGSVSSLAKSSSLLSLHTPENRFSSLGHRAGSTSSLSQYSSSDKRGPQTTGKLNVRVVLPPHTKEIFSVRFSDDGDFLAVGYGDGSVKIYSSETGTVSYYLTPETELPLPVTSMRFRPGNHSTKNVLVVTSASGTVQHWHATSSQLLHTITEADNQPLCLDYRPDGLQFATGGQDCKIRLYDETTRKQTGDLSQGFEAMGHTNRIFSVKFNPEDPNMLLSAGWDDTVQFWDLRSAKSVRSIFGAHVCGDALDVSGNTVLTASWRKNDTIQLWDYGSGKLMSTPKFLIAQPGSPSLEAPPSMAYSAQFAGPNGNLIASCGSNVNEVRLIDRRNGAPFARLHSVPKGLYSMHVHYARGFVAAGGSDGTLHLCDVGKLDATPMEFAPLPS
eukprot:Colp12_sorted_trinity150504_noHs@24907